MTTDRDEIVTSVSRPRRATMRDVAELAGVGLKTVSRVINNEGKVAPETARRVREAAATLRYIPDDQAGNLRRVGRHTGTIGMVVSAVDNPFAATVFRGVEDTATRRRVAVVATSVEDLAERETSAVNGFIRRRVDGIVLTPIAPSQAYLQAEVEHGLPVVCVDRAPAELDVDQVVIDNVGAAVTATRHLLHHGHREIAFLGDRLTIETARERRSGFLAEMARGGIEEPQVLAEMDLHDEGAARAAVHRLLAGPRRPTAIVSGQNLVTIGVVRGLRDLGLNHRIAVVGIDDFQLADLIDPPITVIAQDPYGIGCRAAELLFSRLDGYTGDSRRVVVPTQLEVRGSGELPPPE